MDKGPIWRKLWPGGLEAREEETDGQGGSMSLALGGDEGSWSPVLVPSQQVSTLREGISLSKLNGQSPYFRLTKQPLL